MTYLVMLLQCPFVLESLTTLIALIIPFLYMEPIEMPFQFLVALEFLLAKSACIGFLSGMNSTMNFHVRTMIELFAAISTGIHHLLMLLMLSLLSKTAYSTATDSSTLPHPTEGNTTIGGYVRRCDLEYTVQQNMNQNQVCWATDIVGLPHRAQSDEVAICTGEQGCWSLCYEDYRRSASTTFTCGHKACHSMNIVDLERLDGDMTFDCLPFLTLPQVEFPCHNVRYVGRGNGKKFTMMCKDEWACGRLDIECEFDQCIIEAYEKDSIMQFSTVHAWKIDANQIDASNAGRLVLDRKKERSMSGPIDIWCPHNMNADSCITIIRDPYDVDYIYHKPVRPRREGYAPAINNMVTYHVCEGQSASSLTFYCHQDNDKCQKPEPCPSLPPNLAQRQLLRAKTVHACSDV